jgi:hypothetical protein
MVIDDIRLYKGCPLAVLLLFDLSKDSVLMADFIERHTGYTGKTVTAALRLLADNGRISRVVGGWQKRNNSAFGDIDKVGIIGSVDKENKKKANKTAQMRDNSVSDPIIIMDNLIDKSVSVDNNNSTVWGLLRAYGVLQNDRTRAMVESPYCTAEYITRVADNLKRQGKSGAAHSGLLIRSIEQHVVVEIKEAPSRGAAVLDLVAQVFGGGVG